MLFSAASVLIGRLAGVDTVMAGGLTYRVGLVNKMSASVAVPIQFTTGTWNPNCLGASISAWYDASTNATIRTGAGGVSQANDGNSVSVWQDQSGNTRNSTQVTVGNRPVGSF